MDTGCIYLIVAEPGEQIDQYARECNKLTNALPGRVASTSPAPSHITLIYQEETEEKDELFISSVRKVSQMYRPFKVRLNGFHYFKNRNKCILYIAIQESPLSEIYYSLTKELNVNAVQKYVPHITIKRGIEKKELSAIISQLEKLPGINSFLCDRIILYKNKITDGKKGSYEMILEAPLLQ